ncbi:site-2 protease family protein [Clostridium sp. SHJSY1]|uniref:site-2 protease family protein n=1 Tax=Clostridium sp. SHJSY1 TaxID=2942483 RepID=UPI002874A905|nr:site-2 protease family protein [Clostridium sp. SHJSY1]MDS0524742.1 site-2 protease family protein [Clostridium sp. SHJSY1]
MDLMNNMSLTDFLYSKIIIVPAILLAFAFHEYAHAKVADMLGDKTPRFQGRLTLNPASHLDPLGTLLILFVGFGWAKPVETNPRVFKNYYKDDLKVSIAGPLANLFLAFIGCLCWGVFMVLVMKTSFLPSAISNVIIGMLQAVFSINASLFVFNLLPLPGLDGFWVLRDLKPDFFNSISDTLYRYQPIIWFAVIFLGGRVLSIPVGYVMQFILMIVKPIFGLLY